MSWRRQRDLAGSIRLQVNQDPKRMRFLSASLDQAGAGLEVFVGFEVFVDLIVRSKFLSVF